MNDKIMYEDIVFDIDSIINRLSKSLDIKFKLKNVQSPEYVATSSVSEKALTDFGFKFVGYSSYIKCPIYRYGKNIEALFNETILHIYDLER